MEDLASEQSGLGKEIDQLYVNYRKDPPIRKTPAYLQKRLQRLEELWTQFESNHRQLMPLAAVNQQHPYFINEFFEETAKVYQKMKATIHQSYKDIETTTTGTNPGRSSPQTADEPTKTGQPQAHDFELQSTEVEDPVLKIVKRQRVLFKTITHLLQEIEKKLDATMSTAYYQIKLDLIQQYEAECKHNNQLIWEVADDECPHGYELSYYHTMQDWMQEVIITLKGRLDEHGSKFHPQPTSTQFKLPKIVLPTFDGSYSRWIQFRELYIQLIHQQSLSEAQKMFYLITNLTGEARKLIQHLPVSGDNYASAWDTLCCRYDNNRLLVTDLLNKFLSLPSASVESSTALKNLHDSTKECILGLKNLGLPVDAWDAILVHILVKKFDKTTQALYEQSLTQPKELNSLKEVLQFLEARFQSLEVLGGKTSMKERPYKTATLAAVTESGSQCRLCKQPHNLYACPTFLNKSPHERYYWVKRNNLCVNCMREGHAAHNCTLRACTKCTEKHNTLLHHDISKSTTRQKPHSTSSTTKKQSSPTKGSDLPSDSTTLAAHALKPKESYVLLGTVRLIVKGRNGAEVSCRAILDSGSQLNFVTEALAKKLQLDERSSPINIQGIGPGVRKAENCVTCVIKSRVTGFSTTLEAHILPQITSRQPAIPINPENWPIPKNIKFADPEFYQPKQIDLLLGGEIYYQLLAIGQITIDKELPLLQNTVFGWVVAGKLNNLTSSHGDPVCGICTEDEGKLKEQVEKFWSLEDTQPTADVTLLSPAEQRCESYYNQTTRRNQTGRFVISLPFSEHPSNLGDSEDMAFARLAAMERKFRKHPALKTQYVDFMREYLEQGHMEEVTMPGKQPHYFLPHHCVLKPESTTTKLRVVFDASARTRSGKSLNQILHTGPKIQNELFSVLLRFRLPRYVFTADIEKMYRQILVEPDDRKYQLIVWRENENDPVRCFQLATVTYGVTTAPYLAIKCLRRLALLSKEQFPLGAESLNKDFYVDDAMVGADSLAEILEKQKQLDKLLRSAGFKLRKWCANHPQLLAVIPAEDKVAHIEFHDDNECLVKTLGMTWLPKTDEFQITTMKSSEDQTVTKRRVLSDIAHLFDPLGLMSPVVVTAKIFMQTLWSLKLDWDAAVPMGLHTQWNHFRTNLQALNSIKIPRHVSSKSKTVNQQLHVFADASEKAYGSAIYIRTTLRDGTIIVRLLCAKSRVAPVKAITLPRLELCAAKTAAQLLHRVRQDLNWQDPCFCWTDSQIVLAWINAQSANYHTFVANRIAAIHELTTPQQWRHVPSKDNPADLVSRGVSPERLQDCNLWFYGPIFLHAPESSWPTRSAVGETELEKKSAKISLLAAEGTTSLINTFDHRNSFLHMQRIIAYVLRFTKNCRSKTPTRRVKGPLTVDELEDALVIIIRETQLQGFAEEQTQLQKSGHVSTSSSLVSLNPFLDPRGLIRVGGRLKEANISYDAKHPMLLPYPHEVTKLILIHLHQLNRHAGPQALLAITRQRFWPIKGKTVSRSVVKDCVKCCRTKPQLLSQLMGNLPPDRLQPARPFLHSGVDFCGPFRIHYKTRGKGPTKAYVAIFCCFATKAVHIEVVSDLTTEAFIGALKRFTSRRGNCQKLYCDNATNFVGAKNQMKELEECIYTKEAEERVSRFCATKGIDFNFIPPRSPHFGGLWEAAVKSAKQLFYKSVSAASLTYEELETVMIEIEAILNSRPLTPLSNDPLDLTALTPGHFLIGEPLTNNVDPHAEPVKGNLLYRWKLVAHLKNEFWQRWTKEYLCELQHRYKWNKCSENVQPGTMVILKEDNIPVLSWPLGRIVRTIKGNDHLVRVADVKTATGILRRPIHRMAPLPIESKEPPLVNDTTHEENLSLPEESSTTQTENGIDEPTSSTKKRRRTRSPLSLFLMTCLLLPLLGTAEIITKPFDSQPGLYFEDLGTTYIAIDDWDLVVYFDLSTYRQELILLSTGTGQLRQLCENMTCCKSCNDTVAHFAAAITEIHNFNELLAPHFPRRKKRAPFNFVGNMANALFGVLDADYAEKMSQTVKNLEGNQEHFLAMLRNQTSIIDSTVNIVRTSNLRAQHLIHEVEAFVNQTDLVLSSIEQQLKEQQTLELFNALAIRLILLSTRYQRTQAALLDVVIDTHQGKINPIILTPAQLQTQLNIIKENIPPTLRIPAVRENLLELYHLITIEWRLTATEMVFRLKIPLLSTENFQLLHVVPIPMWVNQSYFIIEPHSKFLMVNLHRDTYAPLSQQEFARCSTTQVAHICKPIHALYKQSNQPGACELQILIHEPILNLCKVATSPTIQRWIPLQSPNQWIYVVNQGTIVTILCGSTISQRVLGGSGLLTISNGCILKDNSTTIRGHNLYSTTLNTALIPSRNFTDLLLPMIQYNLSYQPMPHQPMSEDIANLRERIRELQQQEATPLLSAPAVTHHHIISYATGIAVIIIIAYFVWKIFRRWKTPQRPTPAPRSRSSEFQLSSSAYLNS